MVGWRWASSWSCDGEGMRNRLWFSRARMTWVRRMWLQCKIGVLVMTNFEEAYMMRILLRTCE
jgi:hypothetical protein